MKHYKINELSKLTGFSPVAIRYYDKINLLKPIRSPSGYRLYNQSHVEKLTFLKNAKEVGFTLDEIKLIFGFLKDDPNQKSHVIKELVAEKLNFIDSQLSKIQNVKKSLLDLSKICTGEKNIKECPILIRLSRQTE